MKKLPLGISDFKKLIEEDRYFVDKTLFIKEIIDSDDDITLIPRPRRFGKTINISMLHYFYEAPIPIDFQNANQVQAKPDNIHLFKDLKIWNAGYEYKKKCGKHPVIFMTFKDVKNSSWDDCFGNLKIVVSNEYLRHSYLLNSPGFNDFEKQIYKEIITMKADKSFYENSLKKLSEMLFKYYGTNPVILIDEYDMPIQVGYGNGYYDEIIEFIRNFLFGGLKDNKFLERGVLTGILRVAKESIFSGLNNIEVCSIISKKYADKFGFLEDEVFELLKYKKVKYDKKELNDWYDGYKFGEYEIYNPWSILKFTSSDGDFEPYWINTSGNGLVIRLLSQSGENFKNELEDLINGKSISKIIDDNIVYGDIEVTTDNVWNFLFFSGYLKNESCTLNEGERVCKLVIPNIEVMRFYKTTIINWLKRVDSLLNINRLKNSLLDGDINTFKVLFTNFAMNSLSYFDVKGKNPEKFYHAFVLGIMFHFNDVFEIKSNRESGIGRYDVMLIPKDKNKYGTIFEFKSVEPILNETLESAAKDALRQIQDKKYRTELENQGLKNIREIAIAFEGKKVLVSNA